MAVPFPAERAERPPAEPLSRPGYAPIAEAIEDLRNGQFIVVEGSSPENEGVLTAAGQFATPDAVTFMAVHGCGLICLCLTGERCDRLGLRPMTAHADARARTDFMVSIEAREGVATGISAADRARTIQAAIDPAATPRDLVQPGHMFPIRTRDGGVLRHPAHAEAAVDLARLAGLIPAGVVCAVLNDDGTAARASDLQSYCRKHGLKLVTIADLVQYRRRHETLVERGQSVPLATRYGEFTAVPFRETLTGRHHLALVKGDVAGAENVLVRAHPECLTGDVFHSLGCDCGEQLTRALELISAAGTGALLYLSQEGRGIGLLNKLRAYELQDDGRDTVEANLELGFHPDPRDDAIGAQILLELGLRTIRVITNDPKKVDGLERFGLSVTERLPSDVSPSAGHRLCRRRIDESKTRVRPGIG